VRGQPTLEPASPSDLEQICRLLNSNGLPTADIDEQHLAGFMVARSGGDLAGVVGIEPHGTEALLRSLCVVADQRGRGLGLALCGAAEAAARGTGARELYLLTTDARAYFEKQGFAACSREDTAPKIQSTAEFQTLCPSTATVMSKRLPTVPGAPSG
jgi:amino-acid N-acetyltransferase